jgi:hypothetical protein
MVERIKRVSPALKHAGYSATTILPGESTAEFEKLHRDLISEFAPDGPLEDDIVSTLARLLWRKQNLMTFRIAELARDRNDQIINEFADDDHRAVIRALREKDYEAAEDEARKELGDAYKLVVVGGVATIDRLMSELDLQDRLDALMDKCVKRLLMVRGIKSISVSSPSAPPKKLSGPSKAA